MFVCMHMVTKFPASTKMRRKIERKNGKRQREQFGGKMQNLYLYIYADKCAWNFSFCALRISLFAFHSSEQRHKKTRADKLSDDLFFLYRYFVQIKCVSYLGTLFLVASRNFYYWIFSFQLLDTSLKYFSDSIHTRKLCSSFPFSMCFFA